VMKEKGEKKGEKERRRKSEWWKKGGMNDVRKEKVSDARKETSD
jgi:hypothetical protein